MSVCFAIHTTGDVERRRRIAADSHPSSPLLGPWWAQTTRAARGRSDDPKMTELRHNKRSQGRNIGISGEQVLEVPTKKVIVRKIGREERAGHGVESSVQLEVAA